MKKTFVIIFVFCNWLLSAFSQVPSYQKASRSFKTYADLLQRLSDPGATVNLKGFYKDGDGGGGDFYWNDTSTAIPVTGFFVKLSTQTLGRYIRMYDQNDGLSVKCFGAYGDSIHNDAPAFDVAAYLSDKLRTSVFIPAGNYLLGHTIQFSTYTSVRGESPYSSILLPIRDSTYYDAVSPNSKSKTGFLLYWNVNPAIPDDWIVKFSPRQGIMSNFSIDGRPNSGIDGIHFAAGFKTIENMQCFYTNTLVDKASVYGDFIHVENIKANQRGSDTTKYLVNIPGLGDAITINQIAPGYTGVGKFTTKGVYIGTSRSGHISNIINGVNTFGAGQSGTVSGSHLEGGWFNPKSGNWIFEGNVMYISEDNVAGIVVENENASYGKNYLETIQNNEFCALPTRRGGWAGYKKPDIQIKDVKTSVALFNNIHSFSQSGGVSSRQIMGIWVGSDSNNIFPEWYSYSHILSMQKATIVNQITAVNGKMRPLLSQFRGLDNIDTINVVGDFSWAQATGTYYYSVQVLADPVRMLGRNGTVTPELSYNAIADSTCPRIRVDYGPLLNGQCMIRMYRGNSSGNYNYSVDIPIINCTDFYDNGLALNGFSWNSRTAGAVDALNSPADCGPIDYNNGIVEIKAAVVLPTVGTWTAGDRFIKTNPILLSDSSYLSGYQRITTGSGQVLYTDWLPLYSKTTSTIVSGGSGAGTVTGVTSANSDITISPSSPAPVVTFNRSIGGTLTTQSLTPAATTTYSLGALANGYSDIYATVVHSPTSATNLNFQTGNNQWMRIVATTGNLLLNTTTDVPSSKLTLVSTTQGVLLPRMTTVQKNAIVSPQEGLEVYDLTLHKKCVFTGTVWETIQSL